MGTTMRDGSMLSTLPAGTVWIFISTSLWATYSPMHKLILSGHCANLTLKVKSGPDFLMCF